VVVEATVFDKLLLIVFYSQKERKERKKKLIIENGFVDNSNLE